MLELILSSPIAQGLIAIVIWLLAGRLRSPVERFLMGPSRFDVETTFGRCEMMAESTGLSGARNRRFLIGAGLAGAAMTFIYLTINTDVGAPVWALFALIALSASSGTVVHAATTMRNTHRVLSVEPGARIQMAANGEFQICCDGATIGVGKMPEQAWGEAWRRICADEATHFSGHSKKLRSGG